jgi:hypothetical protein
MPAPHHLASLSRCKSKRHDAAKDDDDQSGLAISEASIAASNRDAAGEGRSWRDLLARVRFSPRAFGTVLARHMRFVGPGLVSSVAYFDP